MLRIFSTISIIFLLLSCRTAKIPIPFNDSVKIQLMDSVVNSAKNDYSPSILPDNSGFLFVTDREGTLFNFKTNHYSHDIWLALKPEYGDSLYSIIPLSNNPNEEPQNQALNTFLNEGGMCFSADFEKLFFTGCNRFDGLGHCDIYEADVTILENKIIVTNIKNLGSNVNSKHWESMPSISSDNKTIYFISNKEKSPNYYRYYYNSYQYTFNDTKFEQVNYNIYFSIFDENENQWLPAKKLTNTINTLNSEFTPFICSDNKTLIFASNSHKPKLGGFDLYYSKFDSTGNWSKPINLGLPINSEFDDICLTLTIDGESGYLSSMRKYPNDNLDIYKFDLTSFIDEVKIISWRQNTIEEVIITVYDNSKNKITELKRTKIPPGIHSFEWDGKDENGNQLKPGKYFYKVQIGDKTQNFFRLLILK